MANKASTDGINFQRHLYCYLVGLVHHKYEYSILYEGDDKIYDVLDDVILKINGNGENANAGLYLFQAKQKMNVTTTTSIQDILYHKDIKIEKYIKAYITYMQSQAQERDGMPTEMIYWTTNDFHTTTAKFLDKFTNDSHIVPTIDCIQKYWIKHWKALFMFPLAQNLAKQSICPVEKKDNSTPFTYLNESIAEALYREILEPVEQSAVAQQEAQTNVKFRHEFLQGAQSLSENAKEFRKSFIIACEMLNTKSEFNMESLNSITFFVDVFDIGTPRAANTSATQDSFSYKGLREEELDWFFKHFIFYVKIPKGDQMVKAIQDLLKEQFDKEMFEKYLITEPQQRAILAGQQQKDCFLTKSYVQSVINMIELKRKLAIQSPKGIMFNNESMKQLEAKITKSFAENCNRSLTVVSKTKVEWTAARLKDIFKCSLVVNSGSDFQRLLKALTDVQSESFGECLINGEVEYLILLDLPNISQCLIQVEQQLAGVRVIAIVADRDATDNLATLDEVERSDVEVDFEQLEIKFVTCDDKKYDLANCLKDDSIDSVKEIEELSTLTDIIVKSDLYTSDEQHYIDRGFEENVRKSLLTSAHAVSIICGTAGDGKTTELLQIAALAQTMDGTVCLYLRANTIAKGIEQAGNVSSLDGFELLLTLLDINPCSVFVYKILKKWLKQVQIISLLVDGFDEMEEQYHDIVVKFLQKMLQDAGCSLIIATRNDSVPGLKKSFKCASYYKLAPFPYDIYFRQLWLGDANETTPELQQNVEFFISDFDRLLKGVGWISLLQVPQLCKIMGIIYHDRIRRPNIQLHTNYEIGSIYDTFMQSKFANTLRGKFDKMDKFYVLAEKLIEDYYYEKHAQLAYQLQHNCFIDLKCYALLPEFGLVMIQHDSSKNVNFMHRTVRDYFLVRYFLLMDIDEKKFRYFLKRYFCVSHANIADKFIDFFLYNTECLTTFKKKIICSYLNSGILTTWIKTALHNATFNTLRLLLSVAPKELLTKLCFRYGASSSINDINLKRLGERQTMLLLQILKECDANYTKEHGYLSILKRMLFEANPDEEDMLEVAIRKPFPEVFDWVVAYYTANFTSETERYLIERIPRYARAIIIHCYAENKDKIIDKLLKLCQDTLPDESVRNCLQNFDLLEELIVSIEIVSQGKEFKQDDRLDLAQKILSFLELYSGKELLLAAKEQSKDKVENLQNEAIKLMLKQWMVTK